MNYKRLLLVLLTYSLLINVNIYGQSIKIEGELRTRGEFRDGFRAPLADSLNPAFVNNMRARLTAFYETKEYRIKVTVQDTKTYGSTGINNTGNSLGLYEAWAEYFFSPKFSGILGRQALEYDDNRLFSSTNWSNTPIAHDLLKLKYESSKFKVHLGGAWNNASDVLYESVYDKGYQSLLYSWVQKTFENFTTSFIWVNEGFQRKNETQNPKTSIYRNTTGINVEMKNKEIPISFYTTGYYQFGYDRDDHKLDAFLLALKSHYKFSDKITAIFGGDYFSGTKYNASKNKDYTFNKLYGANHAFNGSIEYWTTPPRQGLIDLYGGIEIKTNSKLKFLGNFHTFSTSQKMENRENKDIGSEFDLQVDYKLSPSLSIQGGWSTYLKNRGTEIIKKQEEINTHFPQWAYIMIIIKPVFFSTIKEK